MLNDTFASYTWDTDGKNLSTTYQSNGQAWSFTNDAFGHQVEVSINGIYYASYLALGKFKLSAIGQTAYYSEYPLPGGSVLSQGGGATGVQMADWLGTIRATYSYTGGSYQGSSAHAPFGETYANNESGGYPAGFAGQHFSDNNPTNTTYWFPERKLRSSQGRWLTPDPAGRVTADPGNPQSWNRYAYVMNDPMGQVDPDGLGPDELGPLVWPPPWQPNDGVPPMGDIGAFMVRSNNAVDAQLAQQQNTNQAVGNTTEGSLAKVLTNEIGSLSTPKGGDANQLQDGAEALANALINNANKKKPNGVAPDTGTASPDLADAMQNAVTNRAKGAADPVEGRTFYGTSHTAPDRLHSRPIGNGRQSVYASFGPFKDSTSKQQTYIYIYNDPGQ